MLCAGRGIASSRGFIQERATQITAGGDLAPAYLFVGCAHAYRDRIFKDGYTTWEKEGVEEHYHSFSKAKGLGARNAGMYKSGHRREWREWRKLSN